MTEERSKNKKVRRTLSPREKEKKLALINKLKGENRGSSRWGRLRERGEKGGE